MPAMQLWIAGFIPFCCTALVATGVQKSAIDFDHLRQSVVRIQSVSASFDWFHPFMPGQDGVGTGSGFVVQVEPYPLFVTNQHVINDAKDVSLQLLLFGEQQWEAEVVSACSKFDLAMLVLKKPDEFKDAMASQNITLKPLKVSSQVARMGEDVVALGFPLGQDSLKISKGNVAGNEEVDGNICIQSTAPISPGNSGGPLLNANGLEVLGVNFAKATQGENINYVIPAWRVAQMIRKHLADQPKMPVDSKWKRLRVDVPKPELTTIQPNDALYKMGGCDRGIYVSRVGERSFLRNAHPPLSAKTFLVSVRGRELDRFGMGIDPTFAADRVEFPDLIFMTEDLNSDLEFETCSKGSVTKHTVSIAYKPEYDRGISTVEEPVTSGLEKTYEIFGGISIMQMTVNHISTMVSKWGDPAPVRWLHPDYVAKPRLIVTYVPSGSYAADVLTAGSAVKAVNGYDVRTLEDFRRHFAPDQGNVWTLETDMGSELALNYNETLHKQLEGGLAGQSFLLTPGLIGAAKKAGKSVESESPLSDSIVALSGENRSHEGSFLSEKRSLSSTPARGIGLRAHAAGPLEANRKAVGRDGRVTDAVWSMSLRI